MVNSYQPQDFSRINLRSSSVLLPASVAVSKSSLGLSPALRFADLPKSSLSFLLLKKKEQHPGNSLLPMAAVFPFLI